MFNLPLQYENSNIDGIFEEHKNPFFL